MANQFVGVGIIFGFPGGPTNTLAGLGNLSQLQASEFEASSEVAEVKNKDGATSAIVFSDGNQGIKWDFIVSSGTTAGNFTVSSLPTIGQTIAVTDANFTPATATWLIMPPLTVSRGNTDVARATLNIKRWLENTIP
jgi:hypothetical protein